MEELKALNERYEKLSIEHALVTKSYSSVTQLEKENIELKTRLDELWGYGPQDMGRTIGGGPAHKIKACTALLGVHHKTLYCTK